MLGTPFVIGLVAECTVSLHCILNSLLPVLSRALSVMRWRRKWMPFIIEIMSALYLPKKYQRVLPYPVLCLQSFYVFFFSCFILGDIKPSTVHIVVLLATFTVSELTSLLCLYVHVLSFSITFSLFP